MWTLDVESVKPGAHSVNEVGPFSFQTLGAPFWAASLGDAAENAEQIVGLNRPLGRP